MSEYLRPVDLARVVGISTQMVRKYERWGFIPPSERSSSGYRLYTRQHRYTLVVARKAIHGFGWMPALGIMKAIHQGDIAQAIAQVDARHAELHRERRRLLKTLEALQLLQNQPLRKERGKEYRIGEAAEAADLRSSVIRFWESQGLLSPHRDKSSGYRLYNADDVLNLQVIAALRKVGYSVPDIREVLDELSRGRPESAMKAAGKRLAEINERSLRCAAATGAIAEYVVEQGLGV